MSKTAHAIYVYTMALIVLLVTAYLGYYGYNYYLTPVAERFYHPHYDWFKPSGFFGHGLGIVGTLMILFGVVMYIAAKKYRIFERFIRLKYLLEFHIFLCTLGPILILFHTTFKFGGIVSVAFWSMVAVVLSGVVGRFIYIQIPRSIEGRELSLEEVKHTSKEFADKFQSKSANLEIVQETANNMNLYKNFGLLAWLRRFLALGNVNKQLAAMGLNAAERKELSAMITQQWTISRKMHHLNQMQKLFKYWHVVHLPFALIMLVIVVLHVIVTVLFA